MVSNDIYGLIIKSSNKCALTTTGKTMDLRKMANTVASASLDITQIDGVVTEDLIEKLKERRKSSKTTMREAVKKVKDSGELSDIPAVIDSLQRLSRTNDTQTISEYDIADK